MHAHAPLFPSFVPKARTRAPLPSLPPPLSPPPLPPPRVRAAGLERDDYFGDLARDAADSVAVAAEAVYEGIIHRPTSAVDCVVWARRRFDRWFDASIRALCQQFPADHSTEEGQPFWGGTRRRPTPATFDPTDAGHVDFIIAAARLRARALGLTPPTDEALRAAIATSGAAADDAEPPAVDEPIAANEEQAKAMRAQGLSGAAQRRLERHLDALGGPAGRGARKRRDTSRAWPEAFEKDDDSNGHIAFITAASNLRARNYGIPTADAHRSKLIAGRMHARD